jgi:hypothetical protein
MSHSATRRAACLRSRQVAVTWRLPAPARVARRLPESFDQADHVCPSCGDRLTETARQSEDSDEVEVLERQFVLVRHKRKKYRCTCGDCVEVMTGRSGGFLLAFAGLRWRRARRGA